MPTEAESSGAACKWPGRKNVEAKVGQIRDVEHQRDDAGRDQYGAFEAPQRFVGRSQRARRHGGDGYAGQHVSEPQRRDAVAASQYRIEDDE